MTTAMFESIADQALDASCIPLGPQANLLPTDDEFCVLFRNWLRSYRLGTKKAERSFEHAFSGFCAVRAAGSIFTPENDAEFKAMLKEVY